jgi:hypothetical protein
MYQKEKENITYRELDSSSEIAQARRASSIGSLKSLLTYYSMYSEITLQSIGERMNFSNKQKIEERGNT